MTDADIKASFKGVRLSLIQRCIVAVEMANSQKDALRKLEQIQTEINEETK